VVRRIGDYRSKQVEIKRYRRRVTERLGAESDGPLTLEQFHESCYPHDPGGSIANASRLIFLLQV
jgi:hypothetical protein